MITIAEGVLYKQFLLQTSQRLLYCFCSWSLQFPLFHLCDVASSTVPCSKWNILLIHVVYVPIYASHLKVIVLYNISIYDYYVSHDSFPAIVWFHLGIVSFHHFLYSKIVFNSCVSGAELFIAFIIAHPLTHSIDRIQTILINLCTVSLFKLSFIFLSFVLYSACFFSSNSSIVPCTYSTSMLY